LIFEKVSAVLAGSALGETIAVAVHSSTIAAVMPDSLSAPVHVVVSQCLCDIGERLRSPLMARPRSSDVFVLRPEARRIEIEFAVEPVLATLQEIGTLLLQCMCGLFFECPAAPPQQDTERATKNRNGSLLMQSQDTASALFRSRQSTSARTRNPGNGC